MKAQTFSMGWGRLVLTGTALAFGLCSAASASGTARVSTMSSGGKRVIANLDFSGPGNLRASAVLAGRPTLVLREGRAYALVGGGEQPLSSLAQAEAAGITLPNTGDAQIVNLISLKATGRKETRAGFDGDVYDVTFFDRSGRRRIEQIVVSSDPRARELTDLWKSVNDSLLSSDIAAAGDLQKQLQANGLGLLRFSFRYQVDRLDYAVRLPPVQAYAPASAGVAPLVPATQVAAIAAPAAPVGDDWMSRIRHFTQGSVFGTLFGG